MGEVTSAAAMPVMTESTGMTESVSTSEIVSIMTKSTAMIESMRKTIVVKSVSRSISESRISTATAPSTASVTYVIAALSRNHTKEERQSC